MQERREFRGHRDCDKSPYNCWDAVEMPGKLTVDSNTSIHSSIKLPAFPNDTGSSQ